MDLYYRLKRLEGSGDCRILWTQSSGKSSLLISDLFVTSHEKEAGQKRMLLDA
jgi:hypothetical protein